jgi:hypothetical protein
VDSETTAGIRELSRTYDNWFLAIKPLDQPGDTRPKTQLKYRAELAQAIEEVRIGVRLGAIDDITVEVAASRRTRP